MYSIHYVVDYLVRTVVRTVLELESRCDRSHRSATIVESHQSEFVRHSQGSSIPFSIIASDNRCTAAALPTNAKSLPACPSTTYYLVMHRYLRGTYKGIAFHRKVNALYRHLLAVSPCGSA